MLQSSQWNIKQSVNYSDLWPEIKPKRSWICCWPCFLRRCHSTTYGNVVGRTLIIPLSSFIDKRNTWSWSSIFSNFNKSSKQSEHSTFLQSSMGQLRILVQIWIVYCAVEDIEVYKWNIAFVLGKQTNLTICKSRLSCCFHTYKIAISFNDTLHNAPAFSHILLKHNVLVCVTELICKENNRIEPRNRQKWITNFLMSHGVNVAKICFARTEWSSCYHKGVWMHSNL